MNKSSLSAYRISAIEGATHLDVLLACYDALAEDIRLAGEASAVGDIATRCRYTQHAILVLGHLQDWIPLLGNATLEESLAAFYEYLRKELLRLQSSVRQPEFVSLAMKVCETRAVWQQRQSVRLTAKLPAGSKPEPPPQANVDQPRLYCSA